MTVPNMTVSIEKTRAYYHSVKQSDLCQCSYCTNYYRQIRTECAEIAAYLARYGIDIEKPLDLSPLEPDECGMLEYSSCQYVVLGSCEDDFHIRIGETEIQQAAHHPATGIKETHFVLEMYPIRLRWMMA